MQRGVRATGVVALLLLFIAIPISPLLAAGRVWFVPWKVLEPGARPAESLFVLYWIPASPEELRRSDLITSRPLTVYSARCVAMHVVRVDDQARLEAFGELELPAALIADGGGRQLARVPGGMEGLRVGDVESMVRAEFDAREAAAEAAMVEARALESAGDQAGAKKLYEKVARQRCAFPRQAKEAQRALRRIRK